MEPLENRVLLALTFTFNPTAATPQNVIDGFVAAVALWSDLFTDNVTINVDIDFGSFMNPNTLGSTSAVRITDTYTNVRTALSGDATSADDALAVSSLPGGASFAIRLNGTTNNPNGAGSLIPYIDNDGDANNTTIEITRANAKAIGLLAANDAGTDASIKFSQDFTWDFDRTDGISGGTDFVGVAAHEIGHVLGFTSGVDVLDTNINMFDDDVFDNVRPLDLFRYSSPGTIDWTAGQPAGSQYFSIDGGTTSLTTFSTGRTVGDGQQASHWQDNLGIGIMDPTLSVGEFSDITVLDIRAFDVIGWDVDTTMNLAYLGSAGDDDFEVTTTSANATEIRRNNVLIASVPTANLNSLSFTTLGGNDSLTALDDTPGASPIPAGGIMFDGGDDTDTLELTEDTNMTLTDGTLASAAGGSITFSNLEGITLIGGASANTIDASAYTLTDVTIRGEGGMTSSLAALATISSLVAWAAIP